MARSIICVETVARVALSSRSTSGLSVRHSRGRILWLGIVGALAAVSGCAPHHSVSTAETPLDPAHLTVRPREMASGTQTLQAGVQRLDSFPGADSLLGETLVYVPKRCVGTRRSPLVVLLHGGAMTGRSMLEWGGGIFQEFADSNGFILLLPTSKVIGWEDYTNTASTAQSIDLRKIDAGIREVLRRYAIDPTRMAVSGASAGGDYGFDLGYVNGDVFSRIVVFGAGVMPNDLRSLPRHGTPSIYIGDGVEDPGVQEWNRVGLVRWLRHEGYPVTFLLTPGSHGVTRERAERAFRWLADSWR